MNYKELAKKTNIVIENLQELIKADEKSNALESIMQQMIFIRDKALENKNPSVELGSTRKFTYAILASREFASPNELELKDKINEVSRILDSK